MHGPGFMDCGFVLYFEYANTFCNTCVEDCTDAQLCFFPCLQEAETGFVPSVQDFDKKLAEADAYLQILIDQLKVGHDGNPHREVDIDVVDFSGFSSYIYRLNLCQRAFPCLLFGKAEVLVSKICGDKPDNCI